MDILGDPVNRRLIDDFQRGFPLVPRPFADIGSLTGIGETETIARYRMMSEQGVLTRIGAIVAPNTIGASTLCAMKVPVGRIEHIASVVSSFRGVSHNYEREGDLNLWFVATAPDPSALDGLLDRIEAESGFTVRDLRLEEPFFLDLGFPVFSANIVASDRAHVPPDLTMIAPGDTRILSAIEDGIPLMPQTFAVVANTILLTEQDVISTLRRLQAAAIIRRFGVVVSHRNLGFRANAMAVWDLPDGLASAAGRRLASQPGVTLCYRRRRARDWPYNLYCMVHGKDREATSVAVEQIGRSICRDARAHAVLFSTRCFKQTGARFSSVGVG